jgi:hypothetical protein
MFITVVTTAYHWFLSQADKSSPRLAFQRADDLFPSLYFLQVSPPNTYRCSSPSCMPQTLHSLTASPQYYLTRTNDASRHRVFSSLILLPLSSVQILHSASCPQFIYKEHIFGPSTGNRTVKLTVATPT